MGLRILVLLLGLVLVQGWAIPDRLADNDNDGVLDDEDCDDDNDGVPDDEDCDDDNDGFDDDKDCDGDNDGVPDDVDTDDDNDGVPDYCDEESGASDCSHNTGGDNCEVCADGYYGNAIDASAGACQQCPCPYVEGEDGNWRAGMCYELEGHPESPLCVECPLGRVGPRCEFCEDGYFGDPMGLDGSPRPCQKCECYGNIDESAIGNCDRTTGECLRCIDDTAGFNCERCKSGFFGDALAPRNKGDPKNCRNPDEDDDSDGIPDERENDGYGYNSYYEEYYDDADYDGIPDSEDLDDDNDGIYDKYDYDDDNDGVPDVIVSVKPEDGEGDLDFDDDGIIDYDDNDDDNDGIPDDVDSDDDNDGIADEEEYKYEAPTTSAPPPTVQGCCPPGTRLELSPRRGGGKTAKCVVARAVAAEEMEKNVIIDGYKLPQCSRGMLVERVEVANIGTTTTTTTTTTTPEEVYDEEVFELGNYGDENAYGWRLASAADVRDSSGYVKDSVKHVMRDWEWCIACLADDTVIHGSNRGYRIETDRSCRSGVGHKIIVKGGGYRRIKPTKLEKYEAPPIQIQYGAFFSNSDQLRISDKVFEKDEYCIDTTMEEVGATSLACDMCEEEVVCSYLKKLYESLDYSYMQTEKAAFKAIVGEYTSFEEFKAAVEKFIQDLWKLLDSDEDGNVSEILNHSKAKISSAFLSKLTEFLFEKLDINWDEEISAKDWFEMTGDKEGNKNIGRKLISLPSPIYTLYTRLDQDRDEAVTLQELNLFMSRTFALLDNTDDCAVDLDDVIATLEEGKLPKDLQLGAKLLLQHELTLANHALNRIFKLADTNHDNITAVDEILHFSDFDFIESEVKDMADLAVPNMNVFYYIVRQDPRGQREENNVERWLETLQNLMMNDAYKLEEDDIECD